MIHDDSTSDKHRSTMFKQILPSIVISARQYEDHHLSKWGSARSSKSSNFRVICLFQIDTFCSLSLFSWFSCSWFFLVLAFWALKTLHSEASEMMASSGERNGCAKCSAVRGASCKNINIEHWQRKSSLENETRFDRCNLDRMHWTNGWSCLGSSLHAFWSQVMNLSCEQVLCSQDGRHSQGRPYHQSLSHPLFQVLCKSWGFGQMNSVIMCDYESIWIDMNRYDSNDVSSVKLLIPTCKLRYIDGRGLCTVGEGANLQWTVQGSIAKSEAQLGGLEGLEIGGLEVWEPAATRTFEVFRFHSDWNSWNVQSAAICSVFTLCASIMIIESRFILFILFIYHVYHLYHLYIYLYIFIYHVYPSHFLNELLGPGHCVTALGAPRRRVWCTDDRGAGPASPYAPTKKRHLKTAGDRFMDVYGEFMGILIFLISYYDDIYDPYILTILILCSVMSMISMFSMSSVSTSTKI